MHPLLTPFFLRPTLDIAPDLLGKYLVREFPNGERRVLEIKEVEAYDGPEDLANHASKGRTPRTDVMFREAGVWYVYLIYGIHHMLNIVTGEEGYPAAILIRGAGDIVGPGKLANALEIDRSYNGRPATTGSGLYIAESPTVVENKDIVRTPRIGVGYAGEWAKKPYRFVWNTKPKT